MDDVENNGDDDDDDDDDDTDDNDETAAADPGSILGEYVCTGWDMGGMRLDGAGEWMNIENEARGVVCIAGNEYPFTWSIDGDTMTIHEDVGLTFKATYKNGVIAFDTGMIYFFEKK